MFKTMNFMGKPIREERKSNSMGNYKDQKMHIAYLVNLEVNKAKPLKKSSILIQEHYKGPLKYEGIYNYILYKALVEGLYSDVYGRATSYQVENITFPVKKHWVFEDSEKTIVFNKDFVVYYDGHEIKGDCIIKVKKLHPSCNTKLIPRCDKDIIKKAFGEDSAEVYEHITS